MLQTDLDLAEASFVAATARDPGLADGHLGLHALQAVHDIQLPYASLRSMLAHAERFGDEQQRTGIRIESRYWPGKYAFAPLREKGDLFRAGAREALDLGDISTARWLLDVAGHGDPLGDLVLAYLLLHHDDPNACIGVTKRHRDHETLGPEFQLLLAAASLKLGSWGDAELNAEQAQERTESRRLSVEARIIIARVHLARNDLRGAQKLFHDIEIIDPHFPDLASIAGPRILLNGTTPKSKPRSAPRGTATQEPDTWQAATTPALRELLRELDSYIGLADVKDQVMSTCARIEADRRRAAHGFAIKPSSQHLLFMGPPGTGKTTVADLMGRIYHALGVCEHGSVIVAARQDLVGEYQGHSATKTETLCKRAYGGILFIDEAYQLKLDSTGSNDMFGDEAIGTLVAIMENARDRLIVIAAGYEAEMNRFLAANAGLKGRFKGRISFVSYTAEELLAIAKKIAGDRDTLLDPGAIRVLRAALHAVASEGRVDEGGNGRIPRAIVETAEDVRDRRLMTHTDASAIELVTVTDDDMAEAIVRYRKAQAWESAGANGPAK